MLPSIIHRGQKQDGANTEGRQVEKKTRKSQQMTAKQWVPTDRRGRKSREGSEVFIYPLVQSQLPCNWDQQSDEGGAPPQESCEQCSAGQPQRQHTATHPKFQGKPNPLLHLPGHWDALGCTETSPALAGTWAGWAQLCQSPAELPGALGRKAEPF